MQARIDIAERVIQQRLWRQFRIARCDLDAMAHLLESLLAACTSTAASLLKLGGQRQKRFSVDVEWAMADPTVAFFTV